MTRQMKNKILKKAIAALAIPSLAMGCVSVKKVQTDKPDAYAQHAEKNGLVVAVKPFTDEKEVHDTFKMNLLSKGLLPILVVAENHNPSASFLIAKEDVYVLNELEGGTNNSRGKNVTANLESGATAVGTLGALATAVSPVGGLGIVMIGAVMASNGAIIQNNLEDNLLASHTLAPGEKQQGFVYFEIPKKTPENAVYHVVANVKDAATGKAEIFDFVVDLKFNKKTTTYTAK
jgi:hypothetical protein